MQNILELMTSEMADAEILEDYKDLEKKDLQACLLFAVELTKVKSISKLLA